MLYKSGKSGHPCLVPDLRGSAFNFTSLGMMSSVGLHIWPFCVEALLSYYYKWLLNFVKRFSVSLR